MDQQWNKVEQLSVLGVIVPTDDGYCALRLQHVRTRTVVQDDGILHVPTQFAHILREDSVDVGTVLSEEPHSAEPLGVHLVHEGVSVLGKRSCKDDELEVLRHDF